MRNLKNIQANLIFPESDDGSEDDSEEDYPGTAGLAGLVEAQKGKQIC